MQEHKEFTYKATVRDFMRQLRQNLSDKLQRADAATARILPMLYGNVMVYLSFGAELSTRLLIKELVERGVNVYAPITDNVGKIRPVRIFAYTQPESYGNPQEYGQECKVDLDFCVVPMLGFNTNGYRVGYGKGCYDMFLTNNPFVKNATVIGLAYEDQKCEFVEEKNDIPMHYCVTETAVYDFGRKK